MRIALICAAVAAMVAAQMTNVNVMSGSTLPNSCGVGALFVRTSDAQMFVCSAVDTWTQMGGVSSVPSGSITIIDTGTCPVGFSEVSSLNGKTLLGTLAAGGNVGTTGGADTITPAGSNSAPSFTGVAWSPPTLSWPAGVPTFTGTSANTSAVSAGTPAGTNAASATSGNCAATNIAAGTGSTTACKATAPNLTVSAQTFTGSALSTHLHSVTATGTIAWPAGVPTIGSFTPSGSVAAPSFTGTQFDNRSAFTRVIFCKKT